MNPGNLHFVWLAIAAILGLFIGGKWNVPLAAWISPILFMRFFRDSEQPWRSFLLLWAASAIPTIISWRGATAMGFANPMAEPFFFLLTTPIGLTPYVVDRAYHRRFGSRAWSTLVFPIAVCAVDFVSFSGSPFGTFGAAAYSQRGVLAVMQIASVAGLWGITFVMGWFVSVANHVWEIGLPSKRFGFASVCLLAAILGLGAARTRMPHRHTQVLTVAGFSLPAGTLSGVLSQLPADGGSSLTRQVNAIHAQELEQIRKLADEGARAVVLQEGAGMGSSEQVEELIRGVSAIAMEKKIYVVLPTFDFGKTPPVNAVNVIDPNGRVALSHVKYGGNQFEGTLEGSRVLQTLETPYGKWSAVVCWDLDFPNVIRQAGERDVDLLFVPANDWPEVKDIHAGMATFRAVENGMTIFRQTGQGVSAVIDAYGREINRVDAFAENGASVAGVQKVQTPIGSLDTLYPFVGDAVGVVMVFGTLALLAGLFLRRERGR